MAEQHDDGQQFEMHLFDYLLAIAGLTQEEVGDLVSISGKAEPTSEDFAKVPPTPLGASDKILAQAYRLAQMHCLIRLALEERARRNERSN
jgi:hypothetical protein